MSFYGYPWPEDWAKQNPPWEWISPVNSEDEAMLRCDSQTLKPVGSTVQDNERFRDWLDQPDRWKGDKIELEWDCGEFEFDYTLIAYMRVDEPEDYSERVEEGIPIAIGKLTTCPIKHYAEAAIEFLRELRGEGEYHVPDTDEVY